MWKRGGSWSQPSAVVNHFLLSTTWLIDDWTRLCSQLLQLSSDTAALLRCRAAAMAPQPLLAPAPLGSPAVPTSGPGAGWFSHCVG